MDFEVRFRVREAKTHLEYYGFAVWNEQTWDSNGLPGDFTVDRYHLQWKVTTDAAGNNYAHESGEKVRGHKTVHVADDNKTQSIEVTGASGGNFKVEYAGEETGVIAWNATAANVQTALVALAGVAPADVSASGGPLGTSPVTLDWTGDGKTPKLVVSDDDLTGPNPLVTTQFRDKYRVDFGRMWQPKRLYVSARLRVRAGAGCWSDWSIWTTPVHPIDGTSEPIPPVPANTSLTFDYNHATRGNPMRAIVAGDYVGNWDVPGGDVEDDMARYHIQLQHSRDGGSTWEWPPQKKSVRDKDDNDNRWRTVFNNVNRKWDYRYRVNSEDRFNRRGPFGPGAFNANQRLDGWSALVDPGTSNDSPPAPTISMADIDRSKLHLQVDDYGAQWKDRIEYYEWEVYYDSVTAPNLQQKDQFHRGNSKVFPLRKPGGHAVIARVRAYTASDESSAWAQVTASAHTPPTPTISGATFDALGPRHSRYRVVVPVTVNDAGHNDNVDTIVVQLCHKITNATPTNSDKKQKDRVIVGDDPQEALFRSIPKGHYCFVRAKSLDGDRKESAWTSWTALGRARDSGATTTPTSVTGLVVSTPTPRRLQGEWADPDDDEVVRWKVTVKKSGATVSGYPKYSRTNRHVYRVPKPDVLISHSMEVIAVNDMGTESTLGSGSGTPDDDAAGGEGFEVGDIKKRGHSTVPAKWLLCNGNGYATSTYPELFAVIAYTYGGSGATFNVPDLKGRHAVGDSSVIAMGANEGDVEANRSAAHIHASDSTSGTPASDATSQTPTSDASSQTPTADASGQYSGDDATGASPDPDSSGESATHQHGADPPLQTVARGNLAGDAAGPGHSHTIYPRDNPHNHGHGHGSHGHFHGHGTHGHNHTHGGHGHGHSHGGHGHNHGHGGHPHPHPHDSKKRPHLAVKFIIKALP
jgi:microcystin-dependent protein